MQRVEKCGLHLGLPTTRAFASPAAAGGEVSGECNCGATKCELLRVLPLRALHPFFNSVLMPALHAPRF